jgi:glutathione S-transferase
MLRLVIGDKQLSSWSLRPWMLLRHLGLSFEEVCLPLDTQRFHDEIGRYTPARRVPVLLDGALHVWDSLAICEYLSEREGGRGWPSDSAARALARSISAEMHAGFDALRSDWPLQAACRDIEAPLSPEGRRDLERIDSIWSECREEHRSRGTWLFGERYSIADAMYAPVAIRCHTYGATLSEGAAAYLDHVLSDPHIRDWIRDAGQETRREGQPVERT